MPEQSADPVLAIIVGTTLLGSLITCWYLVVAWSRGPLLTFELRRPVPWNSVGAGLAVLMVSLTLLQAVGNFSEPAAEKPSDLEPSAVELLATMLPEVILVGGVLTMIGLYFQTNRRDLGWPRDSRELARDVRIGATTGLAALAPILLTQVALVVLFRGPNARSEHPLIKMLAKGETDWMLMIVATVAAVVVAPVCEEIMFRLLLQGWLEKWEAKRVGLLESLLEPIADIDMSAPADTVITTDAAAEAPPFEPAERFIESPPTLGFAGLPFGLMPIAISSLLFGLAHFGYGPEPIPLFLLALGLGYVYFRTHRIVPSIVAHAIFNSFAMLQLWWPLLSGHHPVPS